jgi:signal transduction histidine kinase
MIEGADGPWGVFGAHSNRTREFSPDDLSFFQSVANILATAIQRKRLEESLRQRAMELEEAAQYKDQFLAVLGHELRNPLGAMTNTLFVLRLKNEANPSVIQLVDQMERQIKQMVRLVDDLRDVTRMRRDKLPLARKRVDLNLLVREAVESIRPMVSARRHELKLALSLLPLPVEADPDRMHQVFTNLLNNAAKYTEPGGALEIETVKMDDRVAFILRDTGMGIEPVHLHRIFDFFVQADRALTHSQGGLGIGLALVKGLVELHGGEVSAHSEGLGRGSEFRVTLPLAAPDSYDANENRTPNCNRESIMESTVA